jgi:alpha-1,2-mannosyltransferase
MALFRLLNDRHLRRALALWACLAVAVCAKAAFSTNPRSVYPQFAASSRHWWADKSLYAEYQQTEHIDGYRYSPAFAVAFTPLAYLPARLGMMLWNVASIAALLWALHVLVRDVLPGVWTPRREGTFLALTLAGSAVGIWSGQSNAIIAAAILLALAAIVRQRWSTAAMLLAVPVFIKIWPLAIVMLLVVFWPRQLAWRFAVACAVLALIPFLTRPPNTVVWQYHEWYDGLTGPLQGRWGGYRDAWTIWEELSPPADCGTASPAAVVADAPTWKRPLPPINPHAYMAMQLASALGVLGWCCWQRRRQTCFHETPLHCGGTDSMCGEHFSNRFLFLIFSIWAAWQLLFGPGTEQLTYGLIAPAASWAVIVSFDEKRARWLTVTAWAMLALLPSGDIEKAVVGVFPAGKTLLPLGVVLFAAWLVWHERGPSRLTSDSADKSLQSDSARP